jgi:hypothetical protein
MRLPSNKVDATRTHDEQRRLGSRAVFQYTPSELPCNNELIVTLAEWNALAGR